jgi:hypothetical protein
MRKIVLYIVPLLLVVTVKCHQHEAQIPAPEEEGYEINGTIKSLCVYSLLNRDDAACAGEVMSRASSSKSVAIREYNRVLEEEPDAGGLVIVTLYIDENGNLTRTSCSYSEIDNQVFKDKIRNWLGSNLPEGEYRNTRILKAALVFEPKGGTAAEPLTESKFNEVVGAYEEFIYYICDSNNGGSRDASLIVNVTITPKGRVSAVDIAEINDIDAATVEDIEEAIQTWEFPKGVETVTYEYRFDI